MFRVQFSGKNQKSSSSINSKLKICDFEGLSLLTKIKRFAKTYSLLSLSVRKCENLLVDSIALTRFFSLEKKMLMLTFFQMLTWVLSFIYPTVAFGPVAPARAPWLSMKAFSRVNIFSQTLNFLNLCYFISKVCVHVHHLNHKNKKHVILLIFFSFVIFNIFIIFFNVPKKFVFNFNLNTPIFSNKTRPYSKKKKEYANTGWKNLFVVF